MNPTPFSVSANIVCVDAGAVQSQSRAGAGTGHLSDVAGDAMSHGTQAGFDGALEPRLCLPAELDGRERGVVAQHALGGRPRAAGAAERFPRQARGDENGEAQQRDREGRSWLTRSRPSISDIDDRTTAGRERCLGRQRNACQESMKFIDF